MKQIVLVSALASALCAQATTHALAVVNASHDIVRYDIAEDGTWSGPSAFCSLDNTEPQVRRCQFANNVVYVLAAQSGTAVETEFGKVVRFTPAGKRIDAEAYFSFNYHADGLAVTPDGRYVFVVVSEGSDPSFGGRILRYDTTTDVLDEHFADLNTFTREACCDTAGNLYVSERSGGHVYKFRVDHAPGEYSSSNYVAKTLTGLDLGGAVCYSPDENAVYQGGRTAIRKLAADDLSELVPAHATEKAFDWFFAAAYLGKTIYFCSYQQPFVYAVDPETCATRVVREDCKLIDLCECRRASSNKGFAVCLAGMPEMRGCAVSDVLVVRETGRRVERWRVDHGVWSYVGNFMSAAAGQPYPMSVAVGNGCVYLAMIASSTSGTIEEYQPDGTHLRTVIAELEKKPDQICISPDGRFAYMTTIDGFVYRIGIEDGLCEKVYEGLTRSRTLRFGIDGYLYVAATADAAIHVFDTRTTPLTKVGAITVFSPGGGFAFAGTHLQKLVVPGTTFEVIDLEHGATKPYPSACALQNSFSAVTVNGRVYAGDWPTGNIVEVPLEPGALTTVVSGQVVSVSSMVNLTESLDSRCQRLMSAIASSYVRFGTPFVYAEPALPREYDLWRMLCDNPDCDVDLSCGIWPSMRNVVGGVVVGSSSVPREVIRFYPQTGLTNFAAGVDTTWSEIPPLRHPLDTPYGYPASSPHFREARGLARYMVDMTGDGVKDCVDIFTDWSEYGVPGPACPLAYDKNGIWTNNQIQAFAYLHVRDGGTAQGTWKEAIPLRSDGKLDLQGGPYGDGGAVFDDFDGDGDMDMITGDFRSEIWYFENIGTPESPTFARGRHPPALDGGVISGALCMMAIQGDDWDGDGRIDILAAEEDGRVSWFRNTGTLRDGMPVFAPRQFFRAKADELKFGCLATPCCVDWDGDGDWDIVAGNSAGYIAFIENLSGSGVEYPRWAEPKIFTVEDPENANAELWLDGNVIRARCGDKNSPQGPAEANWGYSVLTVADWDGDGFLDVMANDVKGSVVVFRNPGRVGTTVMKAPRAVEVEWEGEQPLFEWEWRGPAGKALRAMWRTTPLMHDWNGDGLVDLLMSDADGYLAFYERTRDADGTLRLKHPQRVFLDDKGKPIQLSSAPAGGAGRRKFCLADWDGDGKLDLIVNSVNATVYLNQGTENGYTRFLTSTARQITRKPLSGHTCCPSACDLNGDGRPDLVIGAEDGYFYYYRNPQTNEK